MLKIAHRMLRRLLHRPTGTAGHDPEHLRIGRYLIEMPIDSPVPSYRSRHPLYDTPLAVIAEVVRHKYRDCCAIDIGANVGDTAAAIRTHHDIPVLCIEGDPALFPALGRNLAQMPEVAVAKCFVGSGSERIDLGLASGTGGNATLVNAVRTTGNIETRTLRDILRNFPAFSKAKLLKIDIQGFDFRVLLESKDVLASMRPVLFFEYDPGLCADAGEGLSALRVLGDLGYSRFSYFDNFGNPMLCLDRGQLRAMESLDTYLAINRRYGPVVYYFDICAFHEDDASLADNVHERYRAHNSLQSLVFPPVQNV